MASLQPVQGYPLLVDEQQTENDAITNINTDVALVQLDHADTFKPEANPAADAAQKARLAQYKKTSSLFHKLKRLSKRHC